ncbi:creatininase family protein [Devosia oryzisoli]
MMSRPFWWSEFSANTFAGIDPMQTIALMPVAATEQHGPHLPLGTDTILNQGCLDLLRDRIAADLDLRVLPIMQVGKSNEHIWATGTLTHTAHTLIDAWIEIGLSVARTGIRKLLIVNSHGGNEEIIGIVARELRVQADMLVIKSGWSKFAPPDGLLPDSERRHGIHGGDFETSMMLAFRPDLVVLDRLADFPSVAARDEARFTHLRPTGQHAYAWIASDLNPAGTVGNAKRASAERGHLIAEREVSGMIELLADIRNCPLPEPARTLPHRTGF